MDDCTDAGCCRWYVICFCLYKRMVNLKRSAQFKMSFNVKWFVLLLALDWVKQNYSIHLPYDTIRGGQDYKWRSTLGQEQTLDIVSLDEHINPNDDGLTWDLEFEAFERSVIIIVVNS